MLTDVPFHYCPGCTHGIAHRLVAEVLEELGAEGHCIGIASVGCSVFSYNYFNCDMIQASHGRAPAVATGAKRANPNTSCLLIRATATLQVSVWRKSCTRRRAAKNHRHLHQ